MSISEKCGIENKYVKNRKTGVRIGFDYDENHCFIDAENNKIFDEETAFSKLSGLNA